MLAYDEPGEFHSRAREFLADGLALGQQVWFLGDRDTGRFPDELRDLQQTNGGRAPGAVRIDCLDDRNANGAAVDPVGQVRTFTAGMQDALAAGFTGLRLVAESTLRLRTPEQLDAWACCELLADRYMMTLPFSALDSAPFRLYSARDDREFSIRLVAGTPAAAR